MRIHSRSSGLLYGLATQQDPVWGKLTSLPPSLEVALGHLLPGRTQKDSEPIPHCLPPSPPSASYQQALFISTPYYIFSQEVKGGVALRDRERGPWMLTGLISLELYPVNSRHAPVTLSLPVTPPKPPMTLSCAGL